MPTSLDSLKVARTTGNGVVVPLYRAEPLHLVSHKLLLRRAAPQENRWKKSLRQVSHLAAAAIADAVALAAAEYPLSRIAHTSVTTAP